MRPWFLRTRTSLFASLFLTLAIPAALLIGLSSRILRNELRDHAIHQNELTAQLIGQAIVNEFFGLTHYVQSFARRPRLAGAIASGGENAALEELQNMVRHNAKISRAVITGTNGILRFNFPNKPEFTGANMSQMSWFRGVSQSRTRYVSDVYESRSLRNTEVVMIASPIEDWEGTLLGYLGAYYTLNDLKDWLRRIQPWAAGDLLVYDRSGREILNESNNTKRNGSAVYSKVQQLLNGRPGSLKFESSATGDRYLASVFRVGSIGWTVVAVQRARVVFAPARVATQSIAAFCLACVAGAAVLGLYWLRTLRTFDLGQQHTQANLRAAVARLEKSNQELESLCYSIAHDLRAPLRTMQGFAAALLEDYAPDLDPTGTDYARRIEASARRMDMLVADLLDYGRITHADFPLQALRLDTIVEQLLNELTHEIEHVKGTVEVGSEFPVVIGNPVLLMQTLNNLLRNALKFTKQGSPPQVKLWAEVKGPTARVWVEDNGIGIDPVYHDKIFQIFERLHTIDRYPGTGIGLAIVKAAVERMNGRVGFVSSPGEGSRFWFELPVAQL